MKLTFLLLVVFTVQVAASGYSQSVTYSGKEVSIQKILKAVKEQTGYAIFGNTDLIKLSSPVTVSARQMPLVDFLKEVLREQPITFRISGKTIMLSENKQTPLNSMPDMDETFAEDSLTGVIYGPDNTPLSGASIRIKGANKGVATDTRGRFVLYGLPARAVLEISMVGYETMEVNAMRATTGYTITLSNRDKGMSVEKAAGAFRYYIFRLKESARELEETVVTGYFNKTRESFTGSEFTIKGDDIRRMGVANVMQSISLLDPAVQIRENIEFGSDPNRVPDLTIRGENSFDLRNAADDGRNNPNAPLFILDGAEVSAERVYDLDINRIEAITILKDAAATALYGSRAANGVIIIRTIRPQPGKIRSSFTANYMVSAPDLRDYNLMNGEEKLMYEKLAGVWTAKTGGYDAQMDLDIQYNEKVKEVLRGVNTYWLSKPLRTSVNQRYNIHFEGGDKNFRYGINVRHDNDKGVMIGSDRKRYGIGIVFNYEIGQHFRVRNDLLVDESKGNNSPYGSFATYARQNPHDRITDEEGNYILLLSNGQRNPLFDAVLPQKEYRKYTSIQDNFSIDWRIVPELRLQGRTSLTKQINKSEMYRSPFSSEYAAEIDPAKKGQYTTLSSETIRVDGNLTLAYNKIINKHLITAGVGTNIITSQLEGAGFTATGFLNDNMSYVQYATQFQENSRPSGVYDKSRMIGFFSNLNYGYENRYYIDASFRTDGSSKFGRKSRFAPFWAVGLAWNLHKEKFWRDRNSTMKIRGSAGSTGTVNFTSSQALTTYQYSETSDYNGNLGAVLQGFGNFSLKWQNTFSYNVGTDLSLFKNFLVINFDAYIRITDNLLLPIDVAPSTGFSSYVENLGQMKNQGIDMRFRFNIIRNRRKDLNWSLTLAAVSNKNKIQKLSNALEALNAEANKLESVTGPTPLRTYEAGRSQSALMVVRSAGIDPVTGQEIFIKRTGEYTFDYDYRDKFIIGDTRPLVEGSLISNLSWKGLNVFTAFSFRVGGKLFNSTLKTKVEGANPNYNADRRVLYDRWKQPGDVAKYKRIDDLTDSYQVSRFVQNNNLFSCASFSVTYDLPKRFIQRFSAERFRILAGTTELFRLSTVRAERGTSYPFAQTYTAGINVSF